MTICVKDRQPQLADPKIVAVAIRSLAEMHDEADAVFHAATIMPDHAHLLFTLGSRLRLGQVIGKFKKVARDAGARWRWQEDGFERRLRRAESIEDFAFYIFMNPYRAGLVPLVRRWHGWFCPDEAKLGFFVHLSRDHTVQGEWIEKSKRVSCR